MPFALDAQLATDFLGSVPGWPGWLEPVAASVAFDLASGAHLLHVHVRLAPTVELAQLALRLLSRRTSIAQELGDLAGRADAALVWRGTVYSPGDRGRYVLARWLAGAPPASAPTPTDTTEETV